MNSARDSRRSLRAIVTLCVIVVLAALVLLPAIRHLRDEADRTQTENNLKQCALAIHNYHDTFRTLPNAYDFGGLYANNHPSGRRSLWFHLLPYVEAEAIYGASDLAVQQTSWIPAFFAPSDGHVKDHRGKVSFGANLRLFATRYSSDGGPWVGIPVTEFGKPMQPLPVDTKTSIQANTRLQTIANGASNTIMLVTKHGTCPGGAHTSYFAAPGQSITLPGIEGEQTGAFALGGAHTKPAGPGGPDVRDLTFQTPAAGGRAVSHCANASGGGNILYGHAFHSDAMSVAVADGRVTRLRASVEPFQFYRAIEARILRDGEWDQ